MYGWECECCLARAFCVTPLPCLPLPSFRDQAQSSDPPVGNSVQTGLCGPARGGARAGLTPAATPFPRPVRGRGEGPGPSLRPAADWPPWTSPPRNSWVFNGCSCSPPSQGNLTVFFRETDVEGGDGGDTNQSPPSPRCRPGNIDSTYQHCH